MATRALLLVAMLAALPSWAHEGLHEQLAAMTRQLAREPRNAALYLQRGELHRLHAQYTAALADYARAATLDPSLDAVELARGRMYLDARQPATALEHLDRFLTRHPEHAEGHLTRARVLVALLQPAEAVPDYDAAIAHAPRPTPDLYHERASVLTALGRPDDALRGLDEGLARLGPVPVLQRQAIDLELAARRFDHALQRLDTLTVRREHHLADRGTILEKAGRLAEAHAAYRQALDQIARLPEARHNTQLTRDLETRVKAALLRTATVP